MAEAVQHGYVQKAERDARALKFTLTQLPEGWLLHIMFTDGWRRIGVFTTKLDAEDHIVCKLSQEDH